MQTRNRSTSSKKLNEKRHAVYRYIPKRTHARLKTATSLKGASAAGASSSSARPHPLLVSAARGAVKASLHACIARPSRTTTAASATSANRASAASRQSARLTSAAACIGSALNVKSLTSLCATSADTAWGTNVTGATARKTRARSWNATAQTTQSGRSSAECRSVIVVLCSWSSARRCECRRIWVRWCARATLSEALAATLLLLLLHVRHVRESWAGLSKGSLAWLTEGLIRLTEGLVGLAKGLVGLAEGLVGLTEGLIGLTKGLVVLTGCRPLSKGRLALLVIGRLAALSKATVRCLHGLSRATGLSKHACRGACRSWAIGWTGGASKPGLSSLEFCLFTVQTQLRLCNSWSR
jgi:hypothetical protein